MKETIMSTSIKLKRDNKDLWVEVDGYVNYDVDTSYGEDADGNRGESRIIVEDVTDIEAYSVCGAEIILTPAEVAMAEEALTRALLERD